MTREELDQIEEMVNDAIRRDLPITCEEMTVDEARAQGALGIFNDKYGERVKVYTIGDVSKGDPRRSACRTHQRIGAV